MGQKVRWVKSSFLHIFFGCSVIKRFFLRVFCASHAFSVMVRKYVRETEKTPTPEVLKAMSRAFAIRKKSGKRKTFPRGTWTEATEGTSIRPQVLARHTSKQGETQLPTARVRGVCLLHLTCGKRTSQASESMNSTMLPIIVLRARRLAPP